MKRREETALFVEIAKKHGATPTDVFIQVVEEALDIIRRRKYFENHWNEAVRSRKIKSIELDSKKKTFIVNGQNLGGCCDSFLIYGTSTKKHAIACVLGDLMWFAVVENDQIIEIGKTALKERKAYEDVLAKRTNCTVDDLLKEE